MGKAPEIEVAGPAARAMNHGLAIRDEGGWLFIATAKAELRAGRLRTVPLERRFMPHNDSTENKMTMYYMMDNKAEGRMMIDSKPHDGCQTTEATKARSWIAAKRNFGFELTGLQEMMLKMSECCDLTLM